MQSLPTANQTKVWPNFCTPYWPATKKRFFFAASLSRFLFKEFRLISAVIATKIRKILWISNSQNTWRDVAVVVDGSAYQRGHFACAYVVAVVNLLSRKMHRAYFTVWLRFPNALSLLSNKIQPFGSDFIKGNARRCVIFGAIVHRTIARSHFCKTIVLQPCLILSISCRINPFLHGPRNTNSWALWNQSIYIKNPIKLWIQRDPKT